MNIFQTATWRLRETVSSTLQISAHLHTDSTAVCRTRPGSRKVFLNKALKNKCNHSKVGSLRGSLPKDKQHALCLKWSYCSNSSSFLQTQTFKQAGEPDAFTNIIFLCGNIIMNIGPCQLNEKRNAHWDSCF